MKRPTLKALGLGAALIAATAGSAFAATATASANVRSGPGPHYRVVDALQPGEWVSVNGRAGNWCHVRKAGPDGWVSCRYISSYRGMGPNIILRFGTSGYPRHNDYPGHINNDYPRHDYPGHHTDPRYNGDWDWQNGNDVPNADMSFGLTLGQ